MKEAIQFYYNLYPDAVDSFYGAYFFEYEGNVYYLKEFNYNKELLDSIEKIRYIENYLPMHEIIANKNKQLITSISNRIYILYRLNVNMYRYIDLNDILSFTMLPVIKDQNLIRNNWTQMWSQKIDYFEYQMNQLGKKHKLLYESFPYFVGLSENAISYVKNAEIDFKPQQEDVLTFGHRRIKYNDTHLYLYDYTNVIIDHPTRNVAEYIKSLVINGYDGLSVLDYFIKNFRLSTYGAHILFGRLMFPTFYYDLYQDIIEGNVLDDEILGILSKVNNYEKFLIDAYQLINNHIHIKSVRWLEKRVIDPL